MSNVEKSGRCEHWRDRLPWLILLRTFRIAVSARMLLCAAGGLLGTIAGWQVFWRMFRNSQGEFFDRLRAQAGGNLWPAWPWDVSFAAQSHGGVLVLWARENLHPRVADIVANTLQVTLPFQYLFSGGHINFPALMFLLLCGVWAIAVWAFFGAIMTRTVALRLTREETVPWGQVANFARRRWLAYFTAPLYPLLGILLITLPLILLGLLVRVGFLAMICGVLFWPLALLGGFLMALLLLGLLFGWPLMFSTISVEGTDAFDALSRSYAYVFQRPLRYLWYVIVAAVLGTLGFYLVQYFAQAVVGLTEWGTSWGASNVRMLSLRTDVDLFNQGVGIRFWNALVFLIAAGYPISYLWSAATAIYLLLRRDVDAAELDEIHLESSDETFGMPPLETDAKGVPGSADQAVAAPSATPPAGKNLADEE